MLKLLLLVAFVACVTASSKPRNLGETLRNVASNVYLGNSRAARKLSGSTIRFLQTESRRLRRERKQCRGETRSACVKAVNEQLKINRTARRLLRNLARCARRGAEARRQKCVNRVFPNVSFDGSSKPVQVVCSPRDFRCMRAQRDAFIATSSVVTTTRGTTAATSAGATTPAPANIVNAVRVAVEAADKAPATAVEAGERAVKELQARSARLRARITECRRRPRSERRGCVRTARREINLNRRERRLVRRLERCAQRFRKNEARRVNCVARVTRVLMRILRPLNKTEAPDTIDELNTVEKTVQARLRARLARLRRALKSCRRNGDRRCVRRVTRRIRSVTREELTTDRRFSPRRACLRRRRVLRRREFRLRAVEHNRLYRLHLAASRCQTMKCARRLVRRQRSLEKRFRQARASRKAEWNRLRCPVVLPTTTTTTVTTKAAATTTTAPKKTASPTRRDGLNQRIAALHLKLNKLYLDLDGCSDDACRKSLRRRIRQINRRLRSLWDRRSRRLRLFRARHVRRARLHRMLERLYEQYGRCRNSACRRRVRRALARVKRSLTNVDRTTLGTKLSKAVRKSANRFVRMLRRAMNRCERGSAGDKCRQEVFARFRRETEERDHAVVIHLRKEIRNSTRKRVDRCKGAAACIAQVQLWEQDRVRQLQLRHIRLIRRNALRLCKTLENPTACRAAVQAEFKRDRVEAGRQAKDIASKDVARAVQTASARSGNVAAALTVSALIVAVLVLLL